MSEDAVALPAEIDFKHAAHARRDLVQHHRRRLRISYSLPSHQLRRQVLDGREWLCAGQIVGRDQSVPRHILPAVVKAEAQGYAQKRPGILTRKMSPVSR
jgi:hypothetical protein